MDTKEREKANEEMEVIIAWSIKEEDRVMEELKSNGKFQEGLDANSEYYKPINEETLRRIREVRKKYGAI